MRFHYLRGILLRARDGFVRSLLSGQQGLLGFHPGDNPPAWHAMLAFLPMQNRGFVVLTNGEHGESLAMDAFCFWIEALYLASPSECTTN